VSVHPDPIDIKWLLAEVETQCRTLAYLEAQAAEARWFRAEHIADLQAAGVSLAAIGGHCGVTKQTVHQWTRVTGSAPASADERTAALPRHARPRPL